MERRGGEKKTGKRKLQREPRRREKRLVFVLVFSLTCSWCRAASNTGAREVGRERVEMWKRRSERKRSTDEWVKRSD